MRRLLSGLLVATAIVSLWLAVTLLWRIAVLEDLRDITLARVRQADNRVKNAMAVLVVVGVATAVVWIVWASRAKPWNRAKGLVVASAITFGLGFMALVGSGNRRPKDAEVRVGPTLDRFIQADRSATVGAVLVAAAAIIGVVLVRRISAELKPAA